MPTEPMAEPTLEELSAYLDHELDVATETRVAEHLATCADCQLRLDGLRETAYAVRALPMETPPRTFTIPDQQRQPFRWAPVGWVGSAAAAGLVIGFGLSQLHFHPTSTSTAGSSFFNAPATQRTAEGGAAAPVAAPALSSQQLDAQSRGISGNAATVMDPNNGSRRLVLDTDAASYSATGKMRVTVQLQGSPSSSTNSGDQGLTLTLVRDGVGVALNPVGVESWNGTPIFGGWYDLRSLPLSGTRAGNYRLEATWTVPDGTGRVLQVSVPVQLTGS